MRERLDALTTVTKALPAANANVNSATIDLETVDNSALEHVELIVSIPATTTLADGTDITVKVQDSADDSSYADVAGLGSQIVTGKTGDGSDAVTLRWKLIPGKVRRYVQVNVAVENLGGNNTGTSFTTALAY
jgi:hypothetical protein